MTEQEAVNVLKENKNKGVAYMFLPKEVWNWISENFDNPNLLYLDSMGKWQYLKDADFDDYDNIVFALPDDYALPQKPGGEWVEFEILQDDRFRYFATDNSVNCYLWHEWSRFLFESSQEKWGFTAFGGWKYKDSASEAWRTYPMLIRNYDGVFASGYDCDDKPAIPVKIRFWREK